MFALGIRYLNGFVAASESDDRDRTEWPPHPGRVFMALVSAHFQTGADPNERKALLWLEELENDGEPMAPHIVAPDAVQRAVVTHYVPVNDKAGPSKVFMQSAPLTRNRQPRTFTRAWLEDETVYLIWPEVEPDESVRNALEALCSKVTRIGHSTSQVLMWVAQEEEIGVANWLPDEERAVLRLRLAPPGTLEYLEHRYNSGAVEVYTTLQAMAVDDTDKKTQDRAKKRLKKEFPEGDPPQLRPNLSIDHGYAPPVPSVCSTNAICTVFSPHIITLQLEPDQDTCHQLDLACVLIVSQRWREALISHSNDLSPSVRTILSGHDANGVPIQNTHLAFIPLAFVGHNYADGHLLGMGIGLPNDLSRDEHREIMRAIGRVSQLKLGRLGVWRIEPITASRPPWNLQIATWTAFPEGSTHWSTVTPIVFDHHPKSKVKASYQDEVVAMIRESCTRIGLPNPREVIATSVSTHIGVPVAHEFPRLQRKDGSKRRHTHAILVFDAPVCGPMLLGAGRYRGYGLCRPMNDLHIRGCNS